MLKIAIWGLGAMGAAIAERLRQAPDYEVLGFDIEPANIRDALAIGVIHGAFEPKEISEMPFDLVVIAVPPTETVAILQNLHTTNLIVDVASVKRPIMTATEHLPHFVGGHPMAGTDETGLNGRRKVMLEQARFFLIGEKSDRQKVAELLAPLGSQFETVTVEQHDAVVALTSDATHLIADALVATLGANENKQKHEFVGPGFLDTTRIAAASPDLWTQILLNNRTATMAAVADFITELTRLNDLVANGDADQLLLALTNIQQIRRGLG